MGPSLQWLSLTGGAIIFLYGLFRVDWIPLILGALIVAFSVSKMMKSRVPKGQSKGEDKP